MVDQAFALFVVANEIPLDAETSRPVHVYHPNDHPGAPHNFHGDRTDAGATDYSKYGYHVKLLGSLKPAEAVPDELDSRKAAAERLMQAAEQKPHESEHKDAFLHLDVIHRPYITDPDAWLRNVYLGPDNPKAIQYTRAIATLYMDRAECHRRLGLYGRASFEFGLALDLLKMLRAFQTRSPHKEAQQKKREEQKKKMAKKNTDKDILPVQKSDDADRRRRGAQTEPFSIFESTAANSDNRDARTAGSTKKDDTPAKTREHDQTVPQAVTDIDEFHGIPTIKELELRESEAAAEYAAELRAMSAAGVPGSAIAKVAPRSFVDRGSWRDKQRALDARPAERRGAEGEASPLVGVSAPSGRAETFGDLQPAVLTMPVPNNQPVPREPAALGCELARKIRSPVRLSQLVPTFDNALTPHIIASYPADLRITRNEGITSKEWRDGHPPPKGTRGIPWSGIPPKFAAKEELQK